MQRLRTPKAMTEMQRRTMRVRVDLRALLAGTEAWRRASACERGGCVSWRRLFTKSASSYSFGGNGLALLTAFEGFSSKCYLDSEGVETIGYGHACQSSSTDLPEYGVTCTSTSCSGTLTESQAREVLANDVATFVTCVRNAVTVDVTQNQFDALVSFSYNVGCGAFQSSTLLSQLNGGQLTDEEAQYQLTRWHSGCTAGLERRRFTESQVRGWWKEGRKEQ